MTALYINALSGTGAGHAFNVFLGCELFPDALASGINSAVFDYLVETNKKGRIGVLTMDFPGADLVSEIILSNPSIA